MIIQANFISKLSAKKYMGSHKFPKPLWAVKSQQSHFPRRKSNTSIRRPQLEGKKSPRKRWREQPRESVRGRKRKFFLAHFGPASPQKWEINNEWRREREKEKKPPEQADKKWEKGARREKKERKERGFVRRKAGAEICGQKPRRDLTAPSTRLM